MKTPFETSRTRLVAGACALLGLTVAVPAQEEAAAVEAAAEEIVRLEEWPALEKAVEREVAADLARLRKARTPEMGTQAVDALIAVGAGIVPEVLPALGKEKAPEAFERITEVLLAVTDARHTRLLAREFDQRAVEVRVFALRRAAAFPDVGTRAEAEKAHAAAVARAEKKKGSPEELYAASLAATSAGSLAGLEHLCERAVRGWKELGSEIRTAANAVRGPEATLVCVERMVDADDDGKVAVLRVLAGCGDAETAVGHVRPFLDSEHSGIRIAAINALRGIVDGAPPLEKLSAFDAIEIAKKWKSRI